ncbi:50S ribosomal protein L11 methyltransferase [Roseibium salinum]|nr:50S ribosomal protein L11 methyltransferase [Roseibium salinum]
MRAGRFVVHGKHDRHKVPAGAIALEIEAALAFGTGHHGTTAGCLEEIDRLLSLREYDSILDLGTGTGVLAIAAALKAKNAGSGNGYRSGRHPNSPGKRTVQRCGASGAGVHCQWHGRPAVSALRAV